MKTYRQRQRFGATKEKAQFTCDLNVERFNDRAFLDAALQNIDQYVDRLARRKREREAQRRAKREVQRLERTYNTEVW